MTILIFIISVLVVAIFFGKRVLDKRLKIAREIHGDDYTLCELMLDRVEYMLLGSSGAIFYNEQL
ncbi:hypothetical protein [Campylobacter lanienae]|uniref:hypothetical protein n=1 Tax=Campylobacter lanienae TaxID=75658 RepID=UPI0024327EA8|nr:hypothetical protein [Campylobacter lanienae]